MDQQTTTGIEVGEFASAPEKFLGVSISEMVRHWALTTPDSVAFVSPDARVTWAEYDAAADRIASALAALPDEHAPVALYLPDTMVFHAALCGAYRAGRIAVGIGSRSGIKELAHLMGRAGCRTLITARHPAGSGQRRTGRRVVRSGRHSRQRRVPRRARWRGRAGGRRPGARRTVP